MKRGRKEGSAEKAEEKKKMPANYSK